MIVAKLSGQLKAQLLARKAQLLERIEDNEEAMAFYEESRQPEFTEEAQEEAAESILKTLSEAEWQELKQIERALIKLENETFGICERCGVEIPKGRLLALPAVPLCIACVEGAR